MNYSDYKLIIFDFDNTLAIHHTSLYLLTDDGHERQRLMLHMDDPYRYSYASASMRKLVDYCSNHSILTECITCADNNLIVEFKEKFLRRNYPALHDCKIIASTYKERAMIIGVIADRYPSIPLDQILYVDDDPHMLRVVSGMGIDVVHASMINSGNTQYMPTER